MPDRPLGCSGAVHKHEIITLAPQLCLHHALQKVLHAVVSEYLATGEAVGSQTVTRRYGVDVSAATVRNVMGDLEELGLLKHTHTSAGRIPTERVEERCREEVAVSVVDAHLSACHDPVRSCHAFARRPKKTKNTKPLFKIPEKEMRFVDLRGLLFFVQGRRSRERLECYRSLWISRMTAFATSVVDAVPPRSGVRSLPAATTRPRR